VPIRFAILPKLRAIIKPAFFSLLIFALAESATSCKKETECEAIVTVNDTNGVPVQGASVRVFAGQVDQSGTSDGAGQVKFTFQHPAILDIHALHVNFPGDTAKGIIRLEEGEEVRKTVQF
jgi:hypothetical protein